MDIPYSIAGLPQLTGTVEYPQDPATLSANYFISHQSYVEYPFQQQSNSEINESTINGSGRKPRIRTVFSDSQLRELENRFKNQQYLSSRDRLKIAIALGLSELQVRIWFQNRRAKEKKTRSKPPSHTSVENTTESQQNFNGCQPNTKGSSDILFE